MEPRHIKLEVADRIATVTIDNPPVDALTVEDYQEIVHLRAVTDA